ncbi:MAG: DNA/RNA non-specific endonuclease [Clostridia bacterium]|nr:DNA/RNA non-specific endonuclease [Clostridia bacterium]
MRKTNKLLTLLLSLMLAIALSLTACGDVPANDPFVCTDHGDTNGDGFCDICRIKLDTHPEQTPEEPEEPEQPEAPDSTTDSFDISLVPVWDGKSAFVSINGNNPYFKTDEIVSSSYEFYSALDSLGRCGYAMACLGKDLMPPANDTRGDISEVYPSGWYQRSYDKSIVPGGYIYNRCHLIGWQLTDEDANAQNLITGTQFFNIEGMLPFENMIADYIKEYNNHVMYRVTPVFEGDNLLCTGALIEGYSVEDNGAGIKFCVFCYNVQPDVAIDYSNGANSLIGEEDGESGDPVEYVLNTNSMKIHLPDCKWVSQMSEENKAHSTKTVEELMAEGYKPCATCNP